MRTNRIVIPLLLVAAVGAGCETCQDQYNAVNYAFGATLHSAADMYEAGKIDKQTFTEFYEAAKEADVIRLRMRELAEANDCGGDEIWDEIIALFRQRLRELAAMERSYQDG